MTDILATPVHRLDCNNCEKNYKNKGTLMQHIRNAHKAATEILSPMSMSAKAFFTDKVTKGILVEDVIDQDDLDLCEVAEDHELRKECELASQGLKQHNNDCEDCRLGLVHECVQDGEEIVNIVTKCNPKKVTINPNNDWFEKTNTDLNEMLEIASASLYHSDECDECGQRMEFEEDINEHKARMHNKECVNTCQEMCDDCGELVTNNEVLLEHKKAHHGLNIETTVDEADHEPDAACNKCNIYKQAIIKKDESIHNAGTSLNKVVVEKRSLTGENKALRMRLATAKEQIATTNVNNGVHTIYVCEVCGHECESKIELVDHIHCIECQTMYQSMLELNKHIQIKHVNQITSVCDIKECRQSDRLLSSQMKEVNKTLEETVGLLQKTMEENDNLKEANKDVIKVDNKSEEIKQLKLKLQQLEDNIRTKDTEIKSLKSKQKEENVKSIDGNKKNEECRCKRCGKVCKTERLLRDHIKENHNNTTIPCTECTAKFTVRHALRQHMSTVHNEKELMANYTDVVSYKCNVCEKLYESRRDLTSHINKDHIDVDCTKCLTTFKSWDDVYKHANMCSELTPVIKCNNCNRELLNKSALRSHKTECHGREEVATCRNGDSCRFLRNNRCNYYHAVARQPSGGQVRPVSTPGVQLCRYKDRCNRGRFCPYKHYDQDFPRLNSNRSQ
jgi:uncharacterized C2H2 Zn-finger protein